MNNSSKHFFVKSAGESNTHFVDVVQSNDGVKVCVEVIE